LPALPPTTTKLRVTFTHQPSSSYHLKLIHKYLWQFKCLLSVIIQHLDWKRKCWIRSRG